MSRCVGQVSPSNATVADRAIELMRAYSESATPHSYELWFTYSGGSKPFLNEAVKGALKIGGKLTDEQIETLHAAHLSTARMTHHAEKTGATMLTEIEQVVRLIDQSLGSAARYDASLQSLSADLVNPEGGRSVRDVLASLITETREVASNNRDLEMRLRDSRGEIEALRGALEQVRIETLLDPLTGISNRRHFEDVLISSTAKAKAERSPLSLVVIDIDHFKRFNDAFGHLTGDQVLRLVSSAMKQQVDANVTLARFGGEEFGMVLPGYTREKALICAEKVRASVESRDLLKRATGESLGRITVSVGVAMLRNDEAATSLLDRADACMYRAKSAGRNRTVCDEPELRRPVGAAAA